MGLFDFFKKKKTETGLTDEQLRWNKIWDLWAYKKIESPYAELMTYYSEISNGGHAQYFINTDASEKEISVMKEILPKNFIDNLEKAYEAYLVWKETGVSSESKDIIEECDNFFNENEEIIIAILKKYASEI